ncbi:MAG: glycosyltransferase family 2 protein [Deltaproteobacteria bacterium]|nr:glycosyltransferase family 2 protein [Deltaproteobacteria bacterium]
MVYIILPSFNEEGKIGDLLKDIRSILTGARIPYRVLLVNDGSTDNTVKVANRLLGSMPLTILDHKVNRGVHEAFRTGFKAALSSARDDDIVFTMDADGTHDVKLIPRMAEMVVNGGKDIVIASRFRPGSKIYGVPFYRNFLSYAARYVVPFIFNEKEARDFTIFHRAYSARVLKELSSFYKDKLIETTGFTSNTELLVKARIYFGDRLRVAEIPCELHYETKAGPSKMKVVKNINQYLKFIWRMKSQARSFHRRA